eukprot:scaffold20971_cov36-Prasinocladus_malaysianus.AAC.1
MTTAAAAAQLKKRGGRGTTENTNRYLNEDTEARLGDHNSFHLQNLLDHNSKLYSRQMQGSYDSTTIPKFWCAVEDTAGVRWTRKRLLQNKRR